jgi:replicative DNA helicase
VGVRITQLGQAPEGDPDELIGKVIAEAESLRGVTNAHAIRIRQAVAESLDLINSGDTPVGSSTGFLELDDLMGLPRPGELIIVAGRPGSGKTVFATDWACTVASEGIRTMYVTLEMSAKEITLRMLSALSRVPHAKLRDSTLDTRDWDDLNAAAIRLGDYNLDVWDQARVGIADLRSELLRFASEDRPQMLVVDYIQLAEVSQKLNNRQEQVADLSRGLKLLAKELAMVVIAVAQLNRGPEGRTDKRPQLSDLRESGQLEADADKVILVHRPDMYDPHDRVGEADLIVAKCRNGRTGTVAVAAQLHIMRFADMALPR